MRGSLISLAVVAALVGLLVASQDTVAGGATATVKLKDNFFKPDRKSVSKGTQVRFRWRGSNAHNVTKARGPGGRFASATTSQSGVNFKKRFRKSGRYRIVCTIHSGMKLRLRVRR